MNGRERVECALRGEWPDKRPVMLHNFMMAAHEAQVDMGQYRRDPKLIADVHSQAAEKYGLDGILLDIDTCTVAGAVGVPLDLPEDEPARTKGAHPLLKDLNAVGDLPPPDLASDERVQIWIEAARLLSSRYGDEIMLRGNCDQLPFSLAALMRGMSDWMMDLVAGENEEAVFALLDYASKACEQFVQLMADTGVHMVSHGDSLAGPDMLPPDMYVKYAMPFERRIVRFAHDCGMPHMLHICGNTSKILADMLSSHSDAFEIDYKTDAQRMHDICSGIVAISGTLNPAGALLNGPVENVRREVEELLELYSDSPRLILCSGCALAPDTPPENIEAFVAAARAS